MAKRRRPITYKRYCGLVPGETFFTALQTTGPVAQTGEVIRVGRDGPCRRGSGACAIRGVPGRDVSIPGCTHCSSHSLVRRLAHLRGSLAGPAGKCLSCPCDKTIGFGRVWQELARTREHNAANAHANAPLSNGRSGLYVPPPFLRPRPDIKELIEVREWRRRPIWRN